MIKKLINWLFGGGDEDVSSSKPKNSDNPAAWPFPTEDNQPKVVRKPKAKKATKKPAAKKSATTKKPAGKKTTTGTKKATSKKK
jgi:hypothetical protein